MKKRGVQPNSLCYHYLIHVFSLLEDAGSIDKYFKEMNERGVELFPSMFLAAIKLELASSKERAVAYYEAMRHIKRRPTELQYKLFLIEFGKAKAFELIPIILKEYDFPSFQCILTF